MPIDKKLKEEIYAKLSIKEQRFISSLAIRISVDKKLTLQDVAVMLLAQHNDNSECSEKLSAEINKSNRILRS